MTRTYKTADKKQLLEIFKMNIPTYFDPKELDEFAEYLEQHADTYLTVEHENKIVGGIGYYVGKNSNSGQITWIFLHPNYTRLGLGSKAVEHCLTLLKSNVQVKKLVVGTSQLAYQFFEKFGYQLVKTQKDHWGKGLDLYLMEQDLNSL